MQKSTLHTGFIFLLLSVAILSSCSTTQAPSRQSFPNTSQADTYSNSPKFDIDPSDCKASGESISETIIEEGISPNLQTKPNYKVRLNEWFDECATAPHASLFMAVEAYIKDRKAQAKGYAFEALGQMEEEIHMGLPFARTLLAILGSHIGLPQARVYKVLYPACIKNRYSTACIEAAKLALSTGRPLDEIEAIFEHTKKSEDKRKCASILSIAYLNHANYEGIKNLSSQLPSNVDCLIFAAKKYYYEKRGISSHLKTLTKCKEQCLSQGDCYGCVAYSTIAEEPAQAATIAKASCDCGIEIGCVIAGEHLSSTGKKDEAASLFYRACSKGLAAGCFEYGALLQSEGEMKQANKFKAKACRLGYSNACRAMAESSDEAFGLAVLESACRIGLVPDACGFLARRIHEKGNETLAKQYANTACKLGSGIGCFLKWKWNQNEANSCDTLKRACTLEHGPACREFAIECVEQRNSEAIYEHVLRACELGDGKACYMALKQNENSTESVKLRERACMLGFDSACTAQMNTHILNVACSKHAANACFLLAKKLQTLGNTASALPVSIEACKLGVTNACILAFKLYKATGAEIDALPILDGCCTKGNDTCCKALGKLHVDTGNIPKAYPIFEKLCNKNDIYACACMGKSLYAMGKYAQAREVLNSACTKCPKETDPQEICKDECQDSCMYLGFLIQDSNPNQAIELLEPYCSNADEEHMKACMIAGQLSMQQHGYDKACSMFVKIHAHNAKARMMEGICELRRNNHTKAYELLRNSCINDDMAQSCKLAMEAEPEKSKADLELLEKACELSIAKGCFGAAVIYKGRNDSEAAKIYIDLGCAADATMCIEFRRNMRLRQHKENFQ